MVSRPRRRLHLAVAVLSVVALAGVACSTSNAATDGGPCKPAASPVVTLAAYSNVYDTYGKLISAFQSDWKDKHNGQSIQFLTSFGGSTSQAQAVVNGLQADIVALSLDPDVQTIQDAGLITHDWQHDPDASIVATGAVVFDVRKGNPKNIHDWSDLTQPGLEILTPDPAQSGGAKWNIVAAYGAAMRGKVPGYEANDPADAERLLEGIFKNVAVLDKSANDSLKNFDAGNGDVAINYDYAVQADSATKDGDNEMVVPPSTIAIQTPTVVVDKNAKAHCVEGIAKAFVNYLHTPDAQDVFQSVGLERPIDAKAAQKGTDEEPAVQDYFTADDIGGWDELEKDTVFGPNGAFTTAFENAQG
jgi:sulfate/thiosulfate transport system substrate-binding protein